MLPDPPKQIPDHAVIELRIDDPDRPFPFEAHVAIASYIRHHGRCQVHVTELPYGMWWQELRRDVDLTVSPLEELVDESPSEPIGVWIGPGEWLSPDHAGYPATAASYRAVAWLDPQLNDPPTSDPKPERA